jgi:hypothetical protein
MTDATPVVDLTQYAESAGFRTNFYMSLDVYQQIFGHEFHAHVQDQRLAMRLAKFFRQAMKSYIGLDSITKTGTLDVPYLKQTHTLEQHVAHLRIICDDQGLHIVRETVH